MWHIPRPSVQIILVMVVVPFLFDWSVTLPNQFVNQIERSREGVERIKSFILNGSGRHHSYNNLANITDRFGPRMSGSRNLEDALDFISRTMREEDMFDVVSEETVLVPNWQLVSGKAELISSYRNKTLTIAPLGPSISGNVIAEVIVVKSFDELERRQVEVRDKIVVYNQACPNYTACVVYRTQGAVFASKYGALASLIRSATQYSIYSVHTGMMSYEDNVRKIPTACLTVEDTELIQRLVDRGVKVKISLNIETTDEGDAHSRNIIAEIRGSDFPEQVIIFGGHTDSWYLTDGAMDDGAGFMIGWEVLRVIKKLNLIPRRTLRVVLWTSEENGLIGGKAYYDRHKDESDNVSLILESDMGVFKPRGLKFTGSKTAREILQNILVAYLAELNTTEMSEPGESSDTVWWINEKGVPGSELFSYNERYFDFHHSEGDTMSVLDPDHMDKATALWATVIYSVANLDDLLPRRDISAQTSLSTFHFSQALLITSMAIFAMFCRKQN